MKKFVLTVVILGLVTMGFSQKKPVLKPLDPARDIAIKKNCALNGNEAVNFLSKPSDPLTKTLLAANETQIGNTRYDLMTNQSVQNRLYRFEDGTIGAVWNMGFTDPNFNDRGTGYNFFDGTSWGQQPAVRIENKRVGFPSYAPLGEAGEIVVSHNAINGIELCTRPVKNTGNWNQVLMAGPPNHADLDWPRLVTTGQSHNKVHLFSVVCPVANGGTLYNGQDGALVYSRSQNGGLSWDIMNVTPPGTDINFYSAFGGDAYAIAEPRGDTLAFVAGDNWIDIFLLKSTDGGTNWTKTVIFQHPYPHFKETSTLVTDTPWVCDGSMAVALDHSGKAHVFFGLMRALNEDTLDAQSSYFPYTNGLVYWNEDQPPFISLNGDSVNDRGSLVGWMQDWNGNDTTIGDLLDIGTFELSLTSMPNVTIDQNDNMFLLMAGEMENLDNGTQNYRHTLARASFNGGQTWTDFMDLTGGLTHNFHECIFPTVAPTSDDFIHFMFMADEEPGLAVRGDEDPYSDNMMIYSKVPKSDFCQIDAAFISSTDSVNLNVTGDVDFTSTSTGLITSYTWDFGDGGTSHSHNPTHTYTATGTYLVKLIISDGACTDEFSMNILVYQPGGVESNTLPEFVSQNYPNPFSNITQVEVGLARPADLSLEIFNPAGQKVISLKKGGVNAGRHTFTIDGAGLQKGIYFYTVKTNNNCVTRKMTIN